MRTGRISIFGLVIVLAGVAILIDNLDFTGSDIPGTYWPVLLIAVGLWGWLGGGITPGFGSMLLMTLGGIFLAQNMIDDVSFGELWPVLAIMVGVSILLAPRRRFRGHRAAVGWNRNWRIAGDGVGSGHDANEFFSGGERTVDEEYTGSVARVRLGSGKLDLTRATLPPEGATLNLDIALGGYKVHVPSDWQLDIKADVAMGDLQDRRSGTDETRTGPTLTVEGRVLMGGVEITD